MRGAPLPPSSSTGPQAAHGTWHDCVLGVALAAHVTLGCPPDPPVRRLEPPSRSSDSKLRSSYAASPSASQSGAPERPFIILGSKPTQGVCGAAAWPRDPPGRPPGSLCKQRHPVWLDGYRPVTLPLPPDTPGGHLPFSCFPPLALRGTFSSASPAGTKSVSGRANGSRFSPNAPELEDVFAEDSLMLGESSQRWARQQNEELHVAQVVDLYMKAPEALGMLVEVCMPWTPWHISMSAAASLTSCCSQLGPASATAGRGRRPRRRAPA